MSGLLARLLRRDRGPLPQGGRGREAETQLREFWELVPDAMVIVDASGQILLANHLAERLFGWTEAELIGQPVEMLVPERFRTRHVLRRQDFIHTPSTRLMCAGLDLRGLKRDGTEFPVEINLSSIEIDGRRLAVSAIRDASLQQQAEQRTRDLNIELEGRVAERTQTLADRNHQLHGAEEHLRQVLNSLATFVGVCTPEGILIEVNETALEAAGVKAEDVVGKPLVDSPWWRYSEQVRTQLHDALQRAAAGQTVRYEVETILKDKVIPMAFALVPVCDEADKVTYLVASAIDISESKQFQQQLFEAQKLEAVGRLAGGVAHDFNNLLTVISGYNRLVMAEVPAADEMHQYCQEVAKASERAAALTKQLLAFSRRQILQPRVLEVNEVVRAIEQMLRRLIGEDIELITRLPPDTGRVKADAGQIDQVIMNLVVNARDAMPSGGRLTIETGNVELSDDYGRRHIGVAPGAYVMIGISDNGHGMTADVVRRLFEPFFTTKEKGKGTGLGLSIVYGIVKQNGGDVFVYSEPNQGTSVKIYLPRVDEPAARMEAPGKGFGRRESGNVLLVEDEDMVRKLTREMLKRQGYTVREARNGEAALRILEENPEKIDLLVTDVVMPGMSGRDLSERARRMAPHLPVLYMSGYADHAVIENGVLPPDMVFIQKPFTPEDLYQKVRKVMDASPK